MKRIASLLLALISLACVATAGTRPHYGGTLRVAMQSAPNALVLPAASDPSAYWDVARVLSLVGDNLIRVDAEDRPAARPGNSVAARFSRPPLAIHVAPRNQVSRWQSGVARRHRADSRSAAPELGGAGFSWDHELELQLPQRRADAERTPDDRHRRPRSVPAGGTSPTAQSDSHSQRHRHSDRHRPVSRHGISTGKISQAGFVRRELVRPSVHRRSRNRIRKIASRTSPRTRTRAG